MCESLQMHLCCMMAEWVVTSQLQDPRFNPDLRFLSVWNSHQVCRVSFTCSILPLGVNVWCSVMAWCPIQTLLLPHTQCSQNWLRIHHNPYEKNRLSNKSLLC